MQTFNRIFENQPNASRILTQPSHYKGAESNLLEDEKGLQQEGPGGCLASYSMAQKRWVLLLNFDWLVSNYKSPIFQPLINRRVNFVYYHWG